MKRRDFIQVLGGAVVATGLVGTAPPLLGKKADRVPRRAAIPAPRFGDRRDWWFSSRFGMFVHWGLYSIHGFHEQEQWRARVPRDEYVKLTDQWNPVNFNPDHWLDLMEEAGMKYICLTTKHHDGFCLWDTKLTSYNTMNTPYGRDIVGQLAEACHRRSVPLCLYYSIADWHHPNYPNQGRHHELPPQPQDHPDYSKYLVFLRGQVRELCTNYGEISGFWWDMNVEQHVDPSINAMIRELQPAAVINNRGFDAGDFGTPERDPGDGPDGPVGFERRTEACQSVGHESWGWRVDEDYYTDRYLERSIDSYLARGGNYLLNVGPRPDGTIAPTPSSILRRIGSWMREVGESLHDVTPASELTLERSVLLTRRGTVIYVHLYRDPMAAGVELKPLRVLPRRATLLNTGKPVRCTNVMLPADHREQVGYLRLCDLPVNELPNTVLVVKLEFDSERDFQPPPA